jgi:hypothetical protein
VDEDGDEEPRPDQPARHRPPSSHHRNNISARAPSFGRCRQHQQCRRDTDATPPAVARADVTGARRRKLENAAARRRGWWVRINGESGHAPAAGRERRRISVETGERRGRDGEVGGLDLDLLLAWVYCGGRSEDSRGQRCDVLGARV